MRICISCAKSYPDSLEYWHAKGKNPDGSSKLAPRCKSCEREKNNKYYAEHLPTRLATRERNRNTKRQNKQVLQETKTAAGCMDCKSLGFAIEWPPEALDFDHRPGEIKRFELGTEGRVHSLKIVKQEMQKCDIVCAGHHRIRTKQRQNIGGVGLEPTSP